MPSYTVIETQPTVAANTYTHSGRGGAGNTYLATKATAAHGVSPAVAHLSASNRRFYSGIGGFGNKHAADERPQLSFEDEVHRAEARDDSDALSARHVGIGGAGNVVLRGDSASERSLRRSTESSAASSIWGRLSSTVSRH